ncbi:MAG: TIGR01212 family radical SAM protein, partial [Pirellulaceae bacterium]
MQPPESQLEIPFWRRDGFPYFRQSVFLRQRFGGRVQKVSLDGGFTCPNVDGTVAKG